MYKVRATYLPRDDMEFDLDYYFRVHVPLAQATSAGKLDIVKMDVETDATVLLSPESRETPCVLSLYFETAEDVEVFRRFLSSDQVDSLRDDVAQYTNCELQWTVAKLHEVESA